MLGLVLKREKEDGVGWWVRGGEGGDEGRGDEGWGR